MLSIFGGQTPQQLSDQASGVVDLLQFYGLNQQQILNATDGALAPSGNVALTVPLGQYWVLFGAHAVITFPAGVTSGRLNVNLAIDAGSIALAVSPTSGGVTAGTDFRVAWAAPFPRILLPGYQIRAGLESLTGAATASVGISAQVGVLG